MAYNKEKAHEYYLKNKDRILKQAKQWAADNPDRMKEFNKKYKSSDNQTYRAYCEDNYELWILNSAKRNAERYNLPFNLTIEDILIPKYCPYLNFELTKLRGSGQLDSNASIDKLNPKLGYVKGNVQIISRKANRMKNDATPEELLTFAKSILKLGHSMESSNND
jgi:hypothetical protein